MIESCATCKFFKKFENYENGHCIRFPPTVVGGLYESERDGRQMWTEQHLPCMEPAEWCGEYKQGRLPPNGPGQVCASK